MTNADKIVVNRPYKIFWCKEPNNHTFYLDIKNKRFYKKTNLNNFSEHFYQEKKFYEALADTDFTPKIYSITEKDNFGIIEMEFIEFPPLIGYGRNCFSENKYTIEEIKTIHILVDRFLDLLLYRNLISENMPFEFGLQNTIYDHKTKRLLFFDFEKAIQKTTFVRDRFHNSLNSLPFTEIQNINCEYSLKNFLYPDKIRDGNFDEIYKEGQLLYEDIIKTNFNIYHSFFIDDKFITGQRLPLDEDRLSVFNFSRGEFKDKTVLDIGCNLGEMSIFSAENGASKVIGVDADNIINFTKRYVNHLSKIYCIGDKVYDKIELYQADIRNFEIPDVNICFYLNCQGHFGNPELHSKIGKKVSNTIFIEGHAKEGERERIASILNQFGYQWSWKFLGYCKEGTNCLTENRPLFRGDKILC